MSDMDPVVAVADLVGRSGGKNFEIGYLNDEAPYNWYATATYQGAKIHGEHPSDPAAAAEQLAIRILHGGTCTHCGSLVNAKPDLGHWFPSECIAVRVGKEWTRGCKEKSE